MPTTPAWRGVVDKDGKLIMEPSESSLRKYQLQRLKNKPVTVTIKAAARRKSSGMLGYLFGVVYPIIADELGYKNYEIDQVHDAIIRELRGLQPEPNPLKLRVSLAEMGHEDGSAFVDDVRHWAVTNFGIITPDAGAEDAEHAKTAK